MVWYPNYTLVKLFFNGLYYSALKRKEFLTYAIWTKFSRIENFQKLKLDLEKAGEPEIKLPTSVGSLKKQEFQMENPMDGGAW